MLHKTNRVTKVLLTVVTVSLSGAALASVQLPSAVSSSLESLHPNSTVLTANIDEDGLYLVDLKVNQDRYLVELTKSGRVVSNKGQGTIQDTPEASTTPQHIESVRKLPAAVLAAAENAHPHGVIVHVYQDHYGPRYGRSAFYVTVAKGNQLFDVGLSATGEILKNTIDNRTERVENLPAEIRKVAETTYPTGIIYGVGRRNGVFQLEVLVDGKPYDLDITKTGQVVSNKRSSRE
ncbi:hypothetical protein [Aeoliella sp.]|uniref:hypothetical protein n=1 Tax=Aeoliella sp. TaxID=2795800 RepID=UPI003CCBC55E